MKTKNLKNEEKKKKKSAYTPINKIKNNNIIIDYNKKNEIKSLINNEYISNYSKKIQIIFLYHL